MRVYYLTVFSCGKFSPISKMKEIEDELVTILKKGKSVFINCYEFILSS